MPPIVGTEINATLTDPDMIETVTWQWSQSMTMDGSFTDIDMATSMTYTPVAADDGYYLKATASYDRRRRFRQDGRQDDGKFGQFVCNRRSAFPQLHGERH